MTHSVRVSRRKRNNHELRDWKGHASWHARTEEEFENQNGSQRARRVREEGASESALIQVVKHRVGRPFRSFVQPEREGVQDDERSEERATPSPQGQEKSRSERSDFETPVHLS
jgi:hypothetical protein